MAKFRFLTSTLLFLLMSAAVVYAQTDCPEFVQNTLASVNTICSETGRDEACYGNTQIEASGRTADFRFGAPGDIAAVASIETLRLSSISLNEDIWGIALLNIRANLPDNSEQNATILLFGDVTLANVGRTTVDMAATANSDTDIFLRPNDATVMAAWGGGETIIADGRLDDGSWIRVRIPDGGFGWVPSSVVSLDGDISRLIVIAPDQPFYGPMQAFYVQTGADAPPCTEAPPSGILIQTPEGVGEINLLINEIDIRLGSTAFVQQSAGTMIFCILEGQGEVTYNGTTRVIPEGGYTTISISDLRPSSELTPLEGYGPAAGLAALPTQLLPRQITIAEGLTQEQIRAFFAGEPIATTEPTPEPAPTQSAPIADNLPLAGTWQVTGAAAICREPQSGAIAAQSSDLVFGTGTLTLSADGSSFTFTSPNGTSTHTLTAPGQYFLSQASSSADAVVENYFTTVNSPTSMTSVLTVATVAVCNPIDSTVTWTYLAP